MGENTSENAKWVPFGIVGRPHGVRGDLYLRIEPGEGELLEKGMPVRLEGSGDAARELVIEEIRGTAEAPIVRFAGVADRDQAKALTNLAFSIPADILPEPEEDEFYFHEVEGARVVDEGGVEVGEVTGVWEGGERFYLVCETPKGEAFAPATPEDFLGFDRDTRTVRVRGASVIYPEEVP